MILNEITEALEQKIEDINNERINEGGFRVPKTEITLLGQFSLISNPKISAQFNLIGTADIDALIKGEWVVKQAFKDIIKNKGYIYDEDSEKIWIPPKSTFSILHESRFLDVKAIDPIFAILSKAIKAKEKNKILVAEAIEYFGTELIDKIIEYGGDPEYFV